MANVETRPWHKGVTKGYFNKDRRPIFGKMYKTRCGDRAFFLRKDPNSEKLRFIILFENHYLEENYVEVTLTPRGMSSSMLIHGDDIVGEYRKTRTKLESEGV